MDETIKNSLLIVDDENSNIMALTRILSPEYTIYAAKNGMEAIEVANAHLPDVILLDILMPKVDGYEVIAMLKDSDKTRHIPVIFITGLNPPADEEKGLSLGAADYVNKPFSPAVIKLRVQNQIKIINQTRLTIEKEVAEKSNRAKSEFLSHMSHEIRTPLSAVIGMITIGMNTDDVDKKNYCFERANSASKHLLGIVNDILDMSKIEADKFELSYNEIDVEKMLINIANVVNVRAEEKKQNFIVNLGRNVPAYIESDELRLSQVIANLLTNAIKFTPESGVILLNVENAEETETEVRLKMAVEDTGIGIAKKQQAQLFTSFMQADASITKKFGGTGLGLAISKRIIELMDGKIWLESELGRGAKFIFTVKAKKLPKKPRLKLLESGKAEHLHILAVDDSAETRKYFVQVMNDFKLSCDVASGETEAMEMIKNADRPYDVLFVDWQMPGTDGTELAKKIKRLDGGCSIISMIPMTDRNNIEKEAVAAGVRHFISKPLFPSVLLDGISLCLGEGTKEKERLAPERKVKKSYDFSRHTLLIAEDIEINREIMSAILEETDVSIDYAKNGKLAFSMFCEHPEKYSLILMDINMPEMDGYESAQRIRALDLPRAGDIPIIAMTANVFKEDIEACLASGMNDHTGKPIDAHSLHELLDKYLSHPGENAKMKNVHELKHGIAWDEDLLTGNAIVDMQHQKIFAQVSDLVALCEQGSDAEKLQDTLEFLLDYTTQHTTDEEALQLEYDYPNYENHKKMHDQLKSAILGGLIHKFRESGSTTELSSDANKIIIRWLANHIKNEDKKLSNHIRSVNANRKNTGQTSRRLDL